MADTAVEALRDARLLLQEFIMSPWRGLDVAVGAMRLSISRMPHSERETGPQPSEPSIAQADATAHAMLSAPHVGTLRDIAPAGSTLQAGTPYATLALLDDVIPLNADRTMQVVSVFCRSGELVEYGAPLLCVN